MKNKRTEMLYMVLFFVSLSAFAYSNVMYKEKLYHEQKGVTWHCHKCGRYIWKQDPPYNCPNCGCPKGKVK